MLVMTALGLNIGRANHGWAVYLTDGRELARFRGPGAKARAALPRANDGGPAWPSNHMNTERRADVIRSTGPTRWAQRCTDGML